MAAPVRASVVAADYVAVDVHGSVRTFRTPLRVDVLGFSRSLPGNGYRQGQPGPITTYSFGFESPQRVDVYLADGRRLAVSAATRVLFGGGRLIAPSTPPPRPVPPMPMPMPTVDHEPTGTSEIIGPGDNEAHLIDNGASIEMADRMHTGPDDFDETVRERNQAMVDADGDELAAGAILQTQVQEDLGQRAAFVRINPLSASRSVMGNQVILGDGESREVCRWIGEDVESTAVTVTIGRVKDEPPQTLASGARVLPFFSVLWGTRAFSFTADVDLCVGAQFTINCSSIVVTATLPKLVENGPSTGYALSVAGMLSFLPCVRTAPLTMTVYAEAPFRSSTRTSDCSFDVPKFARRMSVWRTNFSADVPIDISFQDRSSGAPLSAGVHRAASSDNLYEQDPPPVITFPGTTTVVQVTTTLAGRAFSLLAVFELDI